MLPNNPNVRLAAKQAGGLMHRTSRVSVVPTRNSAEGVVALLALDRTSSDSAANVSR